MIPGVAGADLLVDSHTYIFLQRYFEDGLVSGALK
jgi:hypothetical protein